MIKIVVGGQMDKQLLAQLFTKYGGDQIEVKVMSDIEAAVAVQTGQADYYFGACATGAGGALAMAIGLIGHQYCASISIPGKIMDDEEIRQQISEGKKAFGFVNYDAEKVIPIIMEELLKG